MSKLFKFVGVSRKDGQFKVRYANDAGRVRVLSKNGHSDIFFIEMDQPEHKMDCIDALLDVVENTPEVMPAGSTLAVYQEAQELGFVIEATI